MITSLTLALALLLGGYGAAGNGDAAQTPQGSTTSATSSEQPTPPPDNDARSHIIDIG